MEITEAQRRNLSYVNSETLRDLVAHERESGRAFGPLAEAARHELARRGEQA